VLHHCCYERIFERREHNTQKNTMTLNKEYKNQGPRLGAWVAIGAILATQVVAPAVVAGLEFTSQGIASGSVAATMMATEAAAGGGVAAGGMVVVLQSAGALGLRIGAVSGIAIVGALIGVAVVLTVLAVVSDSIAYAYTQKESNND
jgi:Interferon-induced 6-16 family